MSPLPRRANTPADSCRPSEHASASSEADNIDVHRLCLFDLDLSCGHCVTVRLTGWCPVSVACCDRLGGAWHAGTWMPFTSDVDYARLLEETYEQRPANTSREQLQVLSRRARTDPPATAKFWNRSSSGRFPSRVGAAAQAPHDPDVIDVDRAFIA